MLAEILGPDGLIIIGVLIVLLLFGGAKLPKLARSIGGASHEFKKGLAEGEVADTADRSSSAVPSLQDANSLTRHGGDTRVA
mgnify:CR=1 FL=1